MIHICLLTVLLLIAMVLPACGLTVFDFESGNLDGWTIKGDLGVQPTNASDARAFPTFNKQGNYFIGTYESGGDDMMGELISPKFTVKSQMMSLLVGGGSYPNRCFVALVDAETGKKLRSETGSNSEVMTRRYWDVRELIGREVCIQIVDRRTGGWAHINVDDIREMTLEEISEYERQAAIRAAQYEDWTKTVMRPSRRKVYRGEAVKDVAMPMGGIGSGSISICGDGSLREWQIWNQVNASCILPGSFFAIKAGNIARALKTESAGGLKGVAATEFVGEYPIAEIAYKDPDLPIAIQLQAFSPFIPMDPENSGFPAIAYTFTLKNPGREKTSVEIGASLQNGIGFDGMGRIDSFKFETYGGNIIKPIEGKQYQALEMSSSIDPSDKLFGTMTLAVLCDRARMFTWTADAQFKDKFGAASADGDWNSPTPKGRTLNGALIAPVTLDTGEEKQVTFIIAWHFPNRYNDYKAGLPPHNIGNYYNNKFQNSNEVVKALAADFDRLKKETLLFRDTFYNSNLPYYVLDRISAQAGTLTSQSTMWIEDGTCAMFEGAGCCPMNCTHVFNYEQTISCLFPELDRNMRRTDLFVQQDESGFIHHRTVLPLSLPRSSGAFVDGHLGAFLKSYREHLRSADSKWLKEMWPRIKLAMEYVLLEWDKDNDGVLVHEQWNTYDAAMYGPNTFIGTLYLASLRATEEMSKIQGDIDFASRCRKIFESGAKKLDEALWNGDYYIHIDEKSKATDWMLSDWPEEKLPANRNRPYGDGCHADQLLGQWWSQILGMGYVLPTDRVNTTLTSIMKYNWRKDFGTVAQQRPFASDGDKGLLNCTWPRGGRPDEATHYSDEVWTGIEYTIAAMLLWEGRIEEAFTIMKAVSDRYNGVPKAPIKRNPWSEIECGEHYARAMSSWSVLLAAQGAEYSGPDGMISFAPKWRPEDHRSFFTGAEGWGTFEQRRTAITQTNTLKITYGKLRVKTLKLETPAEAKIKSTTLTCNGVNVPVRVTQDGRTLALALERQLTVEAGGKIEVIIAI